MSRVLVTGASGFIGTPVVRLLEEGGHEVHAVGRSTGSGDSTVRWHRADLFNPGEAERLVDEVRPEVLVHLAWITTPGKYLDSVDNVVWLRASLKLAEDVVRRGACRIVWAGTCLEYDAWAAAPFVEDVTPTRPESLYGVSKHALAEVINAAAPAWGIEHGWGRIFNVYGPGEHPSRLIAGTVDALARGRAMSLSQGTQQKDFLHVDDVAAGIVALVETHHVGAVNICSGEGLSVRDVAQRIGGTMDRADLIRLGDRAGSDTEPPAVVGSNERLRSLGWSQRISFEAGLADMIARSNANTDV